MSLSKTLNAFIGRIKIVAKMAFEAFRHKRDKRSTLRRIGERWHTFEGLLKLLGLIPLILTFHGIPFIFYVIFGAIFEQLCHCAPSMRQTQHVRMLDDEPQL